MVNMEKDYPVVVTSIPQEYADRILEQACREMRNEDIYDRWFYHPELLIKDVVATVSALEARRVGVSMETVASFWAQKLYTNPKEYLEHGRDVRQIAAWITTEMIFRDRGEIEV
jgi:hypothetical protein